MKVVKFYKSLTFVQLQKKFTQNAKKKNIIVRRI